MKPWLFLAMALWAVFPVPPVSADNITVEVITLKYRTADQVIPLIRPLVDADGTVTGMQSHLVVRTSPENLNQIRQVIKDIDRLPRRLLITVTQDAERVRQAREAGLSGRVSAGDVRVTVPDGGREGLNVKAGRGEDFVRGRIVSRQRNETEEALQRVQVLEGNPAFIQVGQSIPVPERSVVRTPYGAQVVDSVSYRDAVTGFQALPRVNGDRVVIEISQGREQPVSRGAGAIEVQGLSTTVSGRLGEWIELGGLSIDQKESESRVASGETATVTGQQRVFLKVDEIK